VSNTPRATLRTLPRRCLAVGDIIIGRGNIIIEIIKVIIIVLI
tara:strand:- start:277 stop:405 length:129 start_codon:yes stop_codon:yes gene_type:complete